MLRRLCAGRGVSTRRRAPRQQSPNDMNDDGSGDKIDESEEEDSGDQQVGYGGVLHVHPACM